MGSSPDEPDWTEKQETLKSKIRNWWERQSGDWDFADESPVEDGGLWEGMPEIDSKAVARTAPICEEVLDVDFEIEFVREGGYISIEELIEHLVPQLIEKAKNEWLKEND